MARRGGRRTRGITQPANQIAAVIFGLRENGDIVRISAYRLKGGVRLSGPNGPHIVHASNDKTIEGWRREAALVWTLTHVYDVHPMFENDEHVKQQYEELKTKSAERRRRLAG
jgi:hypothetical protein